MKNILSIIKNDFVQIFTNYAVLIVVVALSILPSLYAWINIKASWDPYSETATGRLKVAFVNNDKGADINDKYVNVGDMLSDKLKDNKALGWQFLSSEDAQHSLDTEKIYASIEVPENFTDKLSSFITNNIEKPSINYKVNEKINAIAPKITDKGASNIQSQINSQIISTISDITLTMAKDAGIEVESEVLPKLVEAGDILHKILDQYDNVEMQAGVLSEKIEKIDKFLDVASDNLPKIEEILGKTDGISDSINHYIIVVQENFNSMSGTIKKDIKTLRDINKSAISSISNINNSGMTDEQKIDALRSVKSKIDGVNSAVNAITDLLNSINEINPNDRITDAVNKLNDVNSRLTSVSQQLDTVISSGIVDQNKLNNIQSILEKTDNILSSLYDNFDSKILPAINKSFDNSISALSKINDAVVTAKNKVPEIKQIIDKAKSIEERGKDYLEDIQRILPVVRENLEDITGKIDKINNSRQLSDVLDLLKNNVTERVDFLKNPVDINETVLYEMGNYGSQMTPFYSVLACWVGLTFLISMLNVNSNSNVKAYQSYFGKMVLFLTISIIQSIVIALGDLYLLKINCKLPGLFILGMILTSVTFTFVVYTLSSVFGNVGKVIAIILMIFQVAGSGGTFPIQLTSEFFIKLNPYLPFTYAISFLREAIGGVYEEVLIKDIGVLLLFIFVSLVIGILFKNIMNKKMVRFTEKIEEGNII